MVRGGVALAAVGLMLAACSTSPPTPASTSGAPSASAAAASPTSQPSPTKARSFLLNFKVSTDAMTPDSFACDQQGPYGRDFFETAPVEVRVRGEVVARSILPAPNTQYGYCQWFVRFDRKDDTPMPELDPSVTADDIRVLVHGHDLGRPSGFTGPNRKMDYVLTQKRIPELYGPSASPTS